MAHKKNDYTNKSILQAAEILDVVADSREPVTVAEVVKATGFKQDSTFRAMATMEASGWIQRIGDRYQLGGKLPLMWARYKARREAERDHINRELEELEVGTGE